MLLLTAASAFSQHQVDVSIRFFDKSLYFPDNPIKVKVELKNNSPENYHFSLADNRFFNLDFEVRSLTNRISEQTEGLKTARFQNQHIFYRDIIISPGEEFSFVVDLTDFIKIDEPGKYRVQASFYPRLNRTGIMSESLKSNNLSLSIRPDHPDMELLTAENTEQMKDLDKQNLAPDEVVEWTILARQRSEWDKFFVYLELKDLFMNNPSRKREYLNKSQEEQRIMLKEYREDLKNEKVDGDIVVVPEIFEIKKTEYTPEEATVKVEAKFKNPTYYDIKEYTYYLHKRDNVWFIYDFEVRNVGTE